MGDDSFITCHGNQVDVRYHNRQFGLKYSWSSAQTDDFAEIHPFLLIQVVGAVV